MVGAATDTRSAAERFLDDYAIWCCITLRLVLEEQYAFVGRVHGRRDGQTVSCTAAYADKDVAERALHKELPTLCCLLGHWDPQEVERVGDEVRVTFALPPVPHDIARFLPAIEVFCRPIPDYASDTLGEGVL
jgi:hypothetical protein